MLLLIAHLAGFLQRLMGEYASQQKMAGQFQSTNRKIRSEISVMTLARRMLDAPVQYLSKVPIGKVIIAMRRQAIEVLP